MWNGPIFDASDVMPEQGTSKHPQGKFPATLTNTELKPNKSGEGQYLAVTFTTPSGTIINRYNLQNNNQQTVDIAVKQLSALCWATGVMRVNMNAAAQELRGAKCMIDVQDQPENPKYSEITRVYDANGNEPGKGAGSGTGGGNAGQGGFTGAASGGFGGGQAGGTTGPGNTGGQTGFTPPGGNPNPGDNSGGGNAGGWNQGGAGPGGNQGGGNNNGGWNGGQNNAGAGGAQNGPQTAAWDRTRT